MVRNGRASTAATAERPITAARRLACCFFPQPPNVNSQCGSIMGQFEYGALNSDKTLPLFFFFEVSLWCEFWSNWYLPLEGCNIFTGARKKEHGIVCLSFFCATALLWAATTNGCVYLPRGTCGCAVPVDGRARGYGCCAPQN
ncbi:hypothetical protein TcCL_Unassigned00991 [Trypanosoma cruzi]|nr:hypothetical protein TcCL_Unassigned00991 [Trypanosoma cruzi]